MAVLTSVFAIGAAPQQPAAPIRHPVNGFPLSVAELRLRTQHLLQERLRFLLLHDDWQSASKSLPVKGNLGFHLALPPFICLGRIRALL